MAKVLIIDDDKIVRRILSQLITREGFEVVEAADGEEGLNKIKASQYQLIFCDIEMPKMNGIDVVKECKELNIQTPVIMVSIHKDEITMEETIKKGANNFVGKPINTRNFLDIIHAHLS